MQWHIAPLSRYTNEPYIVAEVPQYNSYMHTCIIRYRQMAYKLCISELHILNKPYTLHKPCTLKTVLESRTLWWCCYPINWACTLYYVHNRDLCTGDLCDNIGLVGVSAKWSYMSLHHLAIMTEPSLSCLLCFLCMLAIPIYPFFKIRRIFDLLVSPPFLVSFREVATQV